MFSNCEIRSCSQIWGILEKTNDLNVRHCLECSKDVHKVKNIEELEKLTSKGNCVAFFDDKKEILVGKPEYPEPEFLYGQKDK